MSRSIARSIRWSIRGDRRRARWRSLRRADGYSDSYDHFHNFFSSVRSRKPVVEDATFGFRAAGAALLSNLSVERDSVVRWNPETMKIVERS